MDLRLKCLSSKARIRPKIKGLFVKICPVEHFVCSHCKQIGALEFSPGHQKRGEGYSEQQDTKTLDGFSLSRPIYLVTFSILPF